MPSAKYTLGLDNEREFLRKSKKHTKNCITTQLTRARALAPCTVKLPSKIEKTSSFKSLKKATKMSL